MKYDDKRRDCGNLQAKLDSLDSEDGRLRRQLEHNFPDVARALDWLEKNQDKFEKEVFGPPMLSCSVKDDRYRDLVQAPLQKGDFVCFVTQTANDHKTLSHYLFHELKLSVSVRTSLSQYSEFRNPLSREELQRLGLDGFATDYIEGPEPVLAMFCGEKRLHTTAVGLRDISDEAHLLRLQQIQAIGQFAAGGKLYRTSRRAEYNRINTTIREIRPGLFWRDQPVDTAEKAELQQAIDKAKSECEELRQAVGEKKVKLRDLKERGEGIDQKLDELRRQKGELQTAYNRWQALPDKIGKQLVFRELSVFISGTRC
jgi:chromosome segregation ATPase